MIKHYNILVKGRVQGVYYRASTQREAEALGLVGFVRNQRDGSVYLEAEGAEEKLNALVEWCRKGPPSAVVDDVEVTPADVVNFTSFDIRRF